MFSLIGTTDALEISQKRTTNISLLEYANANRNEKHFIDVEICTGNYRISANRLVLSCFSPFFEKMFKLEMKEKYEKSVVINSVDSDSMQSLINFIYTGCIAINVDNVCNLLSSSDYLQICDVKQFCFDFILKAMRPSNCLSVFLIANCYNNERLKHKAYDVIAKNLDEVSTTLNFKSLSCEELTTIILEQERRNVCMSLIYRAVVGWTKHDEANRANYFPELLKLVKLHKISTEFLEEVVKNEELIVNNNVCLKLLVNALTYHCKRMRTKNCDSRIISLGGRESIGKLTEVQVDFRRTQTVFPSLPEDLCLGCCVKLVDCLYYIGGEINETSEDSSSVWKINLLKQDLTWKKVSSMSEARSEMGAAVFDGNIVVVGGISKSSAEQYSLKQNSWEKMPQLRKPRDGNALVSCNNHLYALGGVDHINEDCLSSVECLGVGDQKWHYVKAMQTPRRYLSAINHNGFIYAIGGKSEESEPTTLKSVERYDPNLDEWVFLSNLNYNRQNHSACVFQDNIIVVGGLDENCCVVKAIECYNDLCDKWDVVGETDEELYHHSLVVV